MRLEAAAVAAGCPAGVAVHATAVAIGCRGLLIRGRSGAGKSRLAMALIAASTVARPIVLVGDDRVLLRRGAGEGTVVARPHPRIAGFIERRGLGLVAVPWLESVPLAGCVALGDAPMATEAEPWLRALPALRLPEPALAARTPDSEGEGARRVLDWWNGLVAAGAADRTQVA